MQKPEFYCVGVSHKSAPIEIREKFLLTHEQIKHVLQGFKTHQIFDEIAILSTCNRTEYYIAKYDEKITPRELKNLLVRQKSTENFSQEEKDHIYIYEGSDALAHIFHVAASLDSLVVGESQITGQFKRSITLAKETQTLGVFLTRFFQDVLQCVKRIRTHTNIGKKTVSISHTAVDLAKKVFEDLNDKSFLFIGSGEMIQIAAQYAMNLGAEKIKIANRTIENAHRVIEDLGSGSCHLLSELDSLLAEADIVISSTASPHFIIEYDFFKSVVKQRKSKPLFMVDIAVPRDIDPKCSTCDDVYLFEIDDLQKIIKDNLSERQNEAHKAKEIVSEFLSNFQRWLTTRRKEPILGDLSLYLEDLFMREAQKTLSREIFNSLDNKQQDALLCMLQSISGKLVQDVAKVLDSEAHQIQSIVKQLHTQRRNFPSQIKIIK